MTIGGPQPSHRDQVLRMSSEQKPACQDNEEDIHIEGLPAVINQYVNVHMYGTNIPTRKN